MRKNTATKWRVFAFDRTDGTPVTSDAANITAKIAIDHGTPTAITDTNPTETEDGYYLFDLTAAETNGQTLSIYPESSTADVQVIGSPADVFTVPTEDELGIDAVRRGQSNVVQAAVVSVTSNTVFTITSSVASPDDDAYNGLRFKLRSSLDTTRFVRGTVTDYVGGTQTLTLDTTAPWTVITNDLIEIDLAPADSIVRGIQTVLSGITSLANWLRAFVRKDTADSTAKTEINTGGGAYNETTDSQEAIRDEGSANWTTGSGAARYMEIETPEAYEIPDSGTLDYPIQVRTFDSSGNPVDIDSAAMPTITVTRTTDAADLTSRLGTITKAATGIYDVDFQVIQGTDVAAPIKIDSSGLISATSRNAAAIIYITDAVSVDFTSSDRSNLNAVKTITDQFSFTGSNVNADMQALDAAALRSAVGLAGANLDSQLGTIDSNVDGIKAKTDQLTFSIANQVDATTQDMGADAIDQLKNAGVILDQTDPTEDILNIIIGDDYTDGNGTAKKWTSAVADEWGDLGSITSLDFHAEWQEDDSLTQQTWNNPETSGTLHEFDTTMSVVTASGTQVVMLELTSAQTSNLAESSNWIFGVTVTYSTGKKRTIICGKMSVIKKGNC